MENKEIVRLLEKEREVYAEVVKVMNENELTNGQGMCIVMKLAADIIMASPLKERVEMAKDFEEFSTAMREGFEREIVNREKDGEEKMIEGCRRTKDGLKQTHLVNAQELEYEIKRLDMMLCNCIEIACIYGRMEHPNKKELAKVYEDNARQLREKRDALMEELGRMNDNNN